MDEIAKEYDVIVLGTGKYPACGVLKLSRVADRIILLLVANCWNQASPSVSSPGNDGSLRLLWVWLTGADRSFVAVF